MIRKIMIVIPPHIRYTFSGDRETNLECSLPIGPAYLASSLSDICEVTIYDMGLNTSTYTNIAEGVDVVGDTNEVLIGRIEEWKPDLVGISVNMSNKADISLGILRDIRSYNEDIVLVAGGYHTSALPDHMLTVADYVLRGEADHSLRGLVEYLNDTNPNHLSTDYTVSDLDLLPYPMWEACDMPGYQSKPLMNAVEHGTAGAIVTSRSCPRQCTYCSVPNHMGRYRVRDIDRVMEEVRWLRRVYGVDDLYFYDDNFFVTTSRARSILSMISRDYPSMRCTITAGVDLSKLDRPTIDIMRAANVTRALCGIEGASHIIGRYVGKKLVEDEVSTKIRYMHSVGIRVCGMVIIGFPEETLEEARRSIDYAISTGIDELRISIACPLPGSEYYKYCVDNGLLYEDFNFTNIRYGKELVKNSAVVRGGFERLREEAWDKFNGRS
jgi:anaerobic magnesium-protoporphyrin IX monomethyl ester cyclase